MYVQRVHWRYNLSTSRCKPDKRAIVLAQDQLVLWRNWEKVKKSGEALIDGGPMGGYHVVN